jgi:hypothetical protein
LCGQAGHLAAECEGKPKRKRGEHDEKGGELDTGPRKPYQVSLGVARKFQIIVHYDRDIFILVRKFARKDIEL